MAIVIPITIVVILAAVALMVSWRWRRSKAIWAKLNPEGFQEARIVISGGYRPDHIRVVPGIPVRLYFFRKEDNPCSERVVFSGVGVERRLPAFQETLVEFVPKQPGTFMFTCQWGMYLGKLVVAAPRDRMKALKAVKKGGEGSGR